MEAAAFNSKSHVKDYIWECYALNQERIQKAAEETFCEIDNFKDKCLNEADIDYDFVNKTLFFVMKPQVH